MNWSESSYETSQSGHVGRGTITHVSYLNQRDGAQIGFCDEPVLDDGRPGLAVAMEVIEYKDHTKYLDHK